MDQNRSVQVSVAPSWQKFTASLAFRSLLLSLPRSEACDVDYIREENQEEKDDEDQA